MPSSLLLNSELYSLYKNHTTLEGLNSIPPNSAITFVSEMYAGNGFFWLFVFVADKGFTIQDLLPLVTRLNIPPFLGHSEQTTPQRIKTQQITSVWIHVERAMNRIKNKI